MKVIYPGSFNPWHKGHFDILRRALKIFGEVDVVVAVNKDKRINPKVIKWIITPLTAIKGVNVITHSGLVSDLGRPIVRGARSTSDFIYEKQMAEWNKELGVETIILFSKPELAKVSSTALRELSKYDYGLIKDYIDDEYIYNRYLYVTEACAGTMPEHKIYFGKIASGKSTYTRNLEERVIDSDTMVGTLLKDPKLLHSVRKKVFGFSMPFKEPTENGAKALIDFSKGRISLHEAFYVAARELDTFLYHALTSAIGRTLKWESILKPEASYEAGPIGCYWDYIPPSVISKFQLIKVEATEQGRFKFIESRKLDKNTIKLFDTIYQDPPFFDGIVTTYI